MHVKIRLMKQKGFTLIELLVVISIISLLASVVLTSLNSARAKGRDAKRLQDIHQLQNALELYYSTNNLYPFAGGASSSNGVYVATWSTFLSPTYISSAPNDPINTVGQYGYYYSWGYKKTGNCTSVYTGSNDDYILGTRLENSSISNPNYCSTPYGAWDNSNLNYLIGNN